MKKTDGRKSRDTVPLVHYFFVFFLPEPITKRGIELSIWLSSRKMPTGSNSGSTIDEERKVRLKEKRHKRTEERKLEDISLVEFTRQVVEPTFSKHAAFEKELIISQKEANTKLTTIALAEVRYDSGRHLSRKRAVKGVCKECSRRTNFRCICCDVALHPDECFYLFHVPEEEREEVE
jgi:hypothetical protein